LWAYRIAAMRRPRVEDFVPPIAWEARNTFTVSGAAGMSATPRAMHQAVKMAKSLR
jgi:hypothetical protein